MDPISAFFGAAAAYVASILKNAVAPHIAQKTLPTVVEKIRVLSETTRLDSPELLNEQIQNGVVKPGQFVEGTAFFSLHTMSHQPAVPLSLQMQSLAAGVISAAMKRDASALGNPVGFVLPSTQYPIVHDEMRVGFLYPHSMFGFAVPMFNDGTAETLPFKGRQIILVQERDIQPIENRIVKYRARVLTIPPSDVKTAYPGIADHVCDNMRRAGMLHVLSTCEDNTYVEYLENSTHELIVGSHFIETHWEQEEVIRNAHFGNILNDEIKDTCDTMDLPQPQFSVERVKNLNVWFAPGYYITQPRGYPYFHFQMNTNLIYGGEAKQVSQDFDKMSESIINRINERLSINDEDKDLNAIDNYRTENHTILQSTAARSIDDPVLRIARKWLEKKN